MWQSVGEEFLAPNGDPDARLRVIYSNGTESNLLLRSLQRALYKDKQGKPGSRITDPDLGPLFTTNARRGTSPVARFMSCEVNLTNPLLKST